MSLNTKLNVVFPMAVALGSSKHTDLTLLEDTVNEINELIKYGIVVNDKRISVSVKCIVCDAPARALVRGTLQFNGYCGCERCTQHGECKQRGWCSTNLVSII